MKWRLKDAERQRARGLESLTVLKSPSFRRLVFVRHVLRLGGDSFGLCAFLYVMLKFAVKREQRQICLNYAEREQINKVKRVIRLRSSKTSFIFLNEVWSG